MPFQGQNSIIAGGRPDNKAIREDVSNKEVEEFTKSEVLDVRLVSLRQWLSFGDYH